jgi:NAD-dependent SIR2 family protein deacetylase
MSSHLFIVQGDINQLACDIRLVPTNHNLVVEDYWKINPKFIPLNSAGFTNRVILPQIFDSPEALPVFVDIGGDLLAQEPPIDWYIEGAKNFLSATVNFVNDQQIPAKFKRCKHLFALPLIGTGKGGKKHDPGSILEKLLPMLIEFVRGNDKCDIVLVLNEKAVFGVAQSMRSRFCSADDWSCFHSNRKDELKNSAVRIVKRAISGELSLFLGAGVSYGAGLPLWGNLIRDAAKKAGFSDNEITALEKLNYLDAAGILENRMGNFGQVIADSVKSDVYSLQHSILSSLPVTECITTNYDNLFERARLAAGSPLSVIPYSANEPDKSSSWLLKMHGDVSCPDDIVLSRDHYLFYDDSKGALASIVQAMMLTKHMLFVGFSLTDYNFHKIIASVRSAFGNEEDRKDQFGDALMLTEDKLMNEMWNRDVQLISMKDSGSSLSEASRNLEIFLDYLVSKCFDTRSFILDPKYERFLSKPDYEMCQVLKKVQDLVKEHPGALSSKYLFELLEEHGYENFNDDEKFPESCGLSKTTSTIFPDDSELSFLTPKAAIEKHQEESKRVDSPKNYNHGHVFVLKGDLRYLSCDAWIFPSSGGLRASKMPNYWKGEKEDYGTEISAPKFKDIKEKGSIKLSDSDVRIFRVNNWPENLGSPYGSYPVNSIQDIQETVKQFILLAHRDKILNKKLPIHKRGKHLFALPVLGTGHGGFMMETGAVLMAMLNIFYKAVASLDIDIALVCFDDETYYAAQIGRMKISKNPWNSLSNDDVSMARKLSKESIDGNLVMFISGSGASKTLSDLDSLTLEIAEHFDFDSQKIAQMKSLSVSDRFEVLRSLFKDENEFLKHVNAKFNPNSFSIFYFLLSKIESSAAITTNIDTSFESACEMNGKNISVIGSKLKQTAEKKSLHESMWLLKSNGSIDEPESLILSRNSFVNQRKKRYAIGAILQALMITKHLVFIGNVLSDRVFHRALDEAVKVVSSNNISGALCTVITHVFNEFASDLWTPQVNFVSMASSFDSPESESLRRVEILLDCVCAHMVEHKVPVLDPRFLNILSPEDLKIHHRLNSIIKSMLQSSARNSSAYPRFMSTMSNLGFCNNIYTKKTFSNINALRRSKNMF